MTDITQNADTYPPAIYQISVTDPVLGGAGGIANKAAAALADRTAYQRMRNVTPWVPGLDQPYPAHAYVQRSGLTYKSLVANANIDPATPAAVGIWERWALTQSELDAYMATFLPYGAPAVCPSTGPIGTDVKSKIFKSALGEYWMWLGDAWRVVAGRYKLADTAYTTANGNQTVTIFTYTAHRAGTIAAHFYVSALSASSTTGLVQVAIYKNGAVPRYATTTRAPLNDGIDSTTSAVHTVAAGDVITFVTTGVSCGQMSSMHSLAYID